MKLPEFLDNVHEYMLLEQQTDAICGRLLKIDNNSAEELTAGEKAVFEELNCTQRKIEVWLPRFRKGLNCLNCKHFTTLYDTWDNMEYPRCMYDGENEYTEVDNLCENFEPKE